MGRLIQAENEFRKRTQTINNFRYLFNVFGIFHSMEYTVRSEEEFSHPEQNVVKVKLFNVAWNNFLKEGQGTILFRFYKIGISRNDNKPPSELNCCDDVFFFLKFCRYKENIELIKEIEKLGSITSFRFVENDPANYLYSIQLYACSRNES